MSLPLDGNINYLQHLLMLISDADAQETAVPWYFVFQAHPDERCCFE